MVEGETYLAQEADPGERDRPANVTYDGWRRWRIGLGVLSCQARHIRFLGLFCSSRGDSGLLR